MKHLLFGFCFILFLIQTSLFAPLSLSMSPCEHFSHDYNNNLYAHILMVNGKFPPPQSPHFIETEKIYYSSSPILLFLWLHYILCCESSYTFGLLFYLEWNGCGKKNLIGNSRLLDCHGKATERKGKHVWIWFCFVCIQFPKFIRSFRFLRQQHDSDFHCQFQIGS